MGTRNEHETARKEIISQVKAALDAESITAVEWPSMRFEQPEGLPWYRVTIQQGQSNPAALGPQKLNRSPFVIFLQVFLPIENLTGDSAAYVAADALGSLNNTDATRTDGPTGTRAAVKFRVTSAPSFVTKDGAFEQHNVTLPGYYDITPGTIV
tara:strand:- start:17944 stop:18405 length:462 start_codon:yes stop_codon:yes gene_type:complete